MGLQSGGIGFCLLVAAGLGGSSEPATAAAIEIEESTPELLAMLPALTPPPTIVIDRSGRRQQGQVTYYANSFGGRKMANGEKLQLNSNVAASKSLPLGTVARVTNLRNGKSVRVTVNDHGPTSHDRIIDLSYAAAQALGFIPQGTTLVKVEFLR